MGENVSKSQYVDDPLISQSMYVENKTEDVPVNLVKESSSDVKEDNLDLNVDNETKTDDLVNQVKHNSPETDDSVICIENEIAKDDPVNELGDNSSVLKADDLEVRIEDNTVKLDPVKLIKDWDSSFNGIQTAHALYVVKPNSNRMFRVTSNFEAYCNICDDYIEASDIFNHSKSKRHFRNIKKFRKNLSLLTELKSYLEQFLSPWSFCEICDVEASNHSMVSHVLGSKHKYKEAEINK